MKSFNFLIEQLREYLQQLQDKLYIKYKMGDTNSKQPQKQQTIKSVVEQNYDPIDQELNLGYQKQYWADVLLSQDWTMLKTILLSGCQITDDKIVAIMKQKWRQLTHLDLGQNNLTVKGIRQLTDGKWYKLQSLCLGDNKIQNQGLLTLLQKFHKKLLKLQLYKCSLTGKGIQAIVDCSLINLKFLNISNNLIGSFGVKLLAKSYIPSLRTLKVDCCDIGSEGLKHMTKAQWPKLRSLTLGHFEDENENKIYLSGWQMIYHSHWKQLKQLLIVEKQSICWVNCLLLETSAAQINKYGIVIGNQEQSKQIKAILRSRRLFKN